MLTQVERGRESVISGGSHFHNINYQLSIYFKIIFNTSFFLQSLKEKELVNEKSKLAEIEEIKYRQEKEISKLSEELKFHKQESIKVY